ncbi:MAG: D-ribose pyranase [Planctomycetota bacterium]|jgi:D-ribose pyranase|nr:D-ribose pyranase [Planctomycetota bacterium]
MNEGILNRGLGQAIARQGHGDELLLCDAGFAIPEGVEVVDLSLTVNQPLVETVLAEILRYHSVEGLVVADATAEHSPAKLAKILSLLPPDITVTRIPHAELKKRARSVKTVVRSGDFTAFSNFLLISGAGKRWYSEK